MKVGGKVKEIMKLNYEVGWFTDECLSRPRCLEKKEGGKRNTANPQYIYRSALKLISGVMKGKMRVSFKNFFFKN